MANLKELRVRIASVKSTQKITSAMKMVAAAKLRRAQEAAEASRPYAERMERMLGSLAAAAAGRAGAPKLLAGTGKDDVFGIRYVDRFEKRDGEWKIAHRVVATEWRRVDPVTHATGRGKVGVWGSRDGNDVVDWIMTAAAPS